MPAPRIEIELDGPAHNAWKVTVLLPIGHQGTLPRASDRIDCAPSARHSLAFEPECLFWQIPDSTRIRTFSPLLFAPPTLRTPAIPELLPIPPWQAPEKIHCRRCPTMP